MNIKLIKSVKPILAIFAVLSLASCDDKAEFPKIGSFIPSSFSSPVDNGADTAYSTTKRPGYSCEYTPTADGFLGETHAGVPLYSRPTVDLITKKKVCGVG